MKKKRLLSSGALFLTALIWGSSFFVVKDVTDVFPPSYLLAIRFLLAFFIISVFCFKKFKLLDKKHLMHGGIMGALYAVAYLIQTEGILYTTPGKNAFLTTVYCIFVPFIYWIIDKKRPNAYTYSSAIICIVGIGLISIDDNLSMGKGDALSLLCGVFFALQIVFAGKFTKSGDILLLTMVQFFVAGIICLASGLMFEAFPKEIPTNAILGMGFLVIMPTLLAGVFQNLGQKGASPSAASIIMSLESVFGVGFSVLFYGEALSVRLMIGFLLVFVAVIISETELSFLKKKKKEAELTIMSNEEAEN